MPSFRFTNRRRDQGSSNRIDSTPDHTPDHTNDTTGSGSDFVDMDGDNAHPTTLGDSTYARRRRELLQLRQELADMGADALIDLPCVAVIGGQSAGKSSLVEAVSGISVPRDSGTCTRCPIECSMTSLAGQWSCQISLRIEYDDRGAPLPGSERQPAMLFGPAITNKAEIELWLRRAQMAILSRHTPLDILYTMSAQQLKAHAQADVRVAKFSKNVVCVKINDPDSTDLSFIDLPGLVQNEAEQAINMVRTLVEDVIKRESTIVLVTIPASDDMENQQAVLLARNADPDGRRTVGIITKPDSLTSGASSAREKWRMIMTGQSHVLTNGYYAVRLPDDDERARNITRAQADAVADNFFRETSPWKEVMQQHPNRFGIPNFVSNISKLLMKVIEDALPKLKSTVAELIRKNAEEQAALPKPPSENPIAELLKLVTDFCRDLQTAVFGQNDDKRFVQKNRALYRMFRWAVHETAPDFRPFEDHKKYTRPEDPIPDTPEPTFSEDDEPYDTEGLVPRPRTLDLWGVRKVIQESITWELKNTIPFDAKKVLIKEFTTLWDAPAITCFEGVSEKLAQLIEKLIVKYFGRYRRLSETLGTFIRSQLPLYHDSALVDLKKVLALEKNPLFTQNDQYLSATREKCYLRYRHMHNNASSYIPRPAEARHGFALPAAPVSHAYCDISGIEAKALTALSDLGYRGLTIEDLKRLHPPDAFEDEIGIMADVRAYYQVAYKRIIDYVPLTIEHSLNHALAAGLEENIFAHLNFEDPHASERLKDLLGEHPLVAKKRVELEERRVRLLAIEQKLNAFQL